jgi:hypothetical protein
MIGDRYEWVRVQHEKTAEIRRYEIFDKKNNLAIARCSDTYFAEVITKALNKEDKSKAIEHVKGIRD